MPPCLAHLSQQREGGGELHVTGSMQAGAPIGDAASWAGKGAV